MRFMIIVPATPRSEAGGLPTEAELAAMTDYNEELLRAGVLVGGEGLHPTSRGARLDFGADGEVTVTDGPFAESKELIAGFTLIDVSSRDEALEWARRVAAHRWRGRLPSRAAAGLRRRGLRRGAHARAAGARGADARADRGHARHARPSTDGARPAPVAARHARHARVRPAP